MSKIRGLLTLEELEAFEEEGGELRSLRREDGYNYSTASMCGEFSTSGTSSRAIELVKDKVTQKRVALALKGLEDMA